MPKPPKPAMTFDDQVKKFENRGMTIECNETAKEILQRVNYYKLTGYALHFKKDGKYNADSSFNKMYRTYIFDKKLNSLITDLVESIEGTIKSQVAYHFGHKYGGCGHLDSSNYDSLFYTEASEFIKICTRMSKVNDGKVNFVTWNIQEYGRLPIWVVLEILSLGNVSKMYSFMNSEDKTKIAKFYSIKPLYLESWLEGITNLRNRCAHYSRIYNKNMPIAIQIAKQYKKHSIKNESLFALFIAMSKLIQSNSQWNRILKELNTLFEEFQSCIEKDKIGFPENWEEILKIART